MDTEQYAKFIQGIELTDVFLRKSDVERPLATRRGGWSVDLQTGFKVISRPDLREATWGFIGILMLSKGSVYAFHPAYCGTAEKVLHA